MGFICIVYKVFSSIIKIRFSRFYLYCYQSSRSLMIIIDFLYITIYTCIRVGSLSEYKSYFCEYFSNM